MFYDSDCGTTSADSPPSSTTPSSLTEAAAGAAEDADSLRADLHSLRGRYYDARQELASAELRLSVVAGRDWDRRCQVESLKAELGATHAALASCRAENDSLRATNQSVTEHQEAMHTLAGQVAAGSAEAFMGLHQNLQQAQQALEAMQLQHEAVLVDQACLADLCQRQHAEAAALQDLASQSIEAHSTAQHALLEARWSLELSQHDVQVMTWERDELTGLCHEYQASTAALSYHAEAQAQQLTGLCAERDRLLTLAVSAADDHNLVSLAPTCCLHPCLAFC